MRNHIAVEGIEIDYQPQYTARPWFVYVCYPAPRGKRTRKSGGCQATLAEARARQDELMTQRHVPGWSTLAAAKRADDEEAVAKLVAEGLSPEAAEAEAAAWRAEIEAMADAAAEVV